ncbi:MAG: hypothetical protein RMJ88_16670, partial [Thermogemmata sp.]|nr:hypothetical protein [Thermogemmata sp.]
DKNDREIAVLAYLNNIVDEHPGPLQLPLVVLVNVGTIFRATRIEEEKECITLLDLGGHEPLAN